MALGLSTGPVRHAGAAGCPGPCWVGPSSQFCLACPVRICRAGIFLHFWLPNSQGSWTPGSPLSSAAASDKVPGLMGMVLAGCVSSGGTGTQVSGSRSFSRTPESQPLLRFCVEQREQELRLRSFPTLSTH